MSELDHLFGQPKNLLIVNYLQALERWQKADPRSKEKQDALIAKDKAVMDLASVGLAPGQVEQRTVFTLKGLEHEINSGSHGIADSGSAGAGV